jgi:hypothetical protein
MTHMKEELEVALPVKDWQRLAQVEPSLAALETLCAGSWSPAAAEILYSLVGWYRGMEAPNYLAPEEWTSLCLDDFTPVRAGPPSTETERWLRTTAAFDMARDHLDGLGDCRCPVHRRRRRGQKGGHSHEA